MATSDIRAEQRTVIQFGYDSGMAPLDTLNYVNQGEHHQNESQLSIQIIFENSRGKTYSIA